MKTVQLVPVSLAFKLDYITVTVKNVLKIMHSGTDCPALNKLLKITKLLKHVITHIHVEK